MRIVNLKIDGYGMFHDVSLDSIGPGLVVVYAPNGGGKTTLKSFLQSVLFEETGRKKQKYEPWHGGNHRYQGRVMVETRAGTRYDIHADFATTKQGRFTVTSVAGAPRLSLRDLTSHVSYELHSSIFGIGLDELNDRGLKDDEVKSLIGGIPPVGGKKGLTGVMDSIEKETTNLYKKSGQNPVINTMLAKLAQVNQRIAECQNEQRNIAQLEAALIQCRLDIDALTSEISQVSAKYSHLKQLDAAWKYWPEYCAIEAEIARLTPLAAHFPADGLTTFQNLQKSITEVEDSLQQHEVKRAAVLQEQSDLHVDRAILDAAAKVKSAEQTVSDFRTVQQQLDHLRIAVQESQEQVIAALKVLPDDGNWTAERVLAMERTATEASERELADNLRRTRIKLDDLTAKLKAASSRAPVQTDDDCLSNDLANLEEERERLERALRAAVPELDPTKLETALAPLTSQMSLFSMRQRELEKASRDLEDTRSLVASFLREARLNEADIAEMDVSATEQAVTEARQKLGSASDKERELIDDLSVAEERYETAMRALSDARKEVDAKWSSPPPDDTSLNTQQALVRSALVLIPQRSAAADYVLRCEAAVKEAEQPVVTSTPAPPPASGTQRRMLGAVMAVAGIILAALFHAMVPVLAMGVFLLAAGLVLAVVQQPASPTAAATDRAQQEAMFKRLQANLDAARKAAEAIDEKCASLAEQLGCELTELSVTDAQSAIDRSRHDARTYERDQRQLVALQEKIETEMLYRDSIGQKKNHASDLLSRARETWAELMGSLHLTSEQPPSAVTNFLHQVRECKAHLLKIETTCGEIADIQTELQTICNMATPACSLLDLNPPTVEWLTDFTDMVTTKLETLKGKAKVYQGLENELRDLNHKIERKQEELKTVAVGQQVLQQEIDAADADYCQALEAWKSFLGRININTDLDPDGLDGLYQLASKAANALKFANNKIEEARTLTSRRDTMVSSLNAFVEQLGMPLLQPDGYLEAVQQLVDRLEAATKTEQTRGQLNERLNGIKQASESDLDRLARERRALADLFTNCRVKTDSEFREGMANLTTLVKLRNERGNLKGKLEGLSAPGDAFERLITELKLVQRPYLDDQLQQCFDAKAGLEDKSKAKREELGKLSEQIQSAEQMSLLEDLFGEKQNLASQIKIHAEQWMIGRLALTLMTNARSVYEKERQPEVTKWAGNFLRTMSDGEYTGILQNMDNEAYMLLDSDGIQKTVPWNRALQDQVYLALRMALVKQHATSHEPLPVIMDDVLVNCDKDRVAGATRAIVELAREFQVFYFTCHTATHDLLQAYAPNCDCIAIHERRFVRLASR